MPIWEDGDGGVCVKWAGRRKPRLISSVCPGRQIGGMVKMSLLLAILVLKYQLPVKAVDYYLEKLIEP